MAKWHTGSPKWIDEEKRWRLRVQKDSTRKVFYSSIAGRRGMLECRAAADKWLDGNAPTGNPRISDVYAEWLTEVRDTVSTDAYRKHESAGRNYILPEIGDLRISRMTNEQMFQRIINNAFRAGVHGKPLSRKSLQNLRGSITQFLKYCRKSGYTTLHPENLEIPRKAERAHKQVLQPDEIRILFSADDAPGVNRLAPSRTEWFIYAFRFLLLTGLRPGELIGLKWTDIDAGGTLRIRRSINYFGETTPGKNDNARRDIVLPERARDTLSEQRMMLDNAGIESEYVFPDETGSAANQKMLRRHLIKFCNRHGMTEVSPYELRHTWYSINKELPAELVKAVGGHSENMDTFGTYGHRIDGELERAAALIDDTMDALLKR